MMEHAVLEGDEVVLEEEVRIGQHVRHAGEDVATGSLVFDAGTEIRPAHIGVLASLGVMEATVYPRARVGVLSTGDELQSEPGALGRGKIRDSNRRTLLALLQAAGCEPVNLGVVGDVETDIQSVLEGALPECDAIITSGGVSVGIADHMKTVLGRLSGGSAHWMEVAIKPAKPFGFATIGEQRTPVMCMPGNPVSALVSFELLARGALRFMMGHSVLDRPRWRATAEEPLRRRRDGKVHLVRVMASVDGGDLLVRPIAGQGSHQLRSTALANALAILADGDGIDTGDVVSVILLEPDAVPAVQSVR
jgi:molybdopterin molybdotransferase